VDPPAPPPTLWNFLGIPQTIDKIQDATLNRFGNNPGKERTPSLKQIADPANLNSPNPAIKTAAKIKADQDAAPQKIKAIKYLATVGCGCYPGVKDALLASLDDCTEEVRYEAAIAFCKAAGNPCKNCEKNGCCDAAVMNKLHEMAYGQDDKGCYKETSERVRAAATNALNACQRMHPQGAPQPQTTPGGKKELPQVPLTPSPAPKEVPLSLPPETPLPAPLPPDPKTSTTGGKASAPIIEAGFARVSPGDPDSPATVPTSVAAMDPRGPYCQPPGGVSGAPSGAPGTGPEPGTQPSGEGAAAEAAPSPNALAGNFGAAVGPQSAAPNMMGDFASSGGNIIFSQRTFDTFTPYSVVASPSISIAGGDRVFKIAEDDSPFPRDRVFFDYNHYVNALTDARSNAQNLDRFTFGAEKTFFDGRCSIEVRLPVVGGLDPTQSVATGPGLLGTEFGDVPLVFKAILLKWENAVLAAGVAVTLPTAKGASLIDANGIEQVRLHNDSVHVGPILGLSWQPDDRWFVIGFIQADFDCRGNDVDMQTGNGFTQIGTLYDRSLLFGDLAVGYWVYSNPDACWITGVAPTVELHNTMAMQGAGIVTGTGEVNGFQSIAQIGAINSGSDVLDLTAGVHVLLGTKSTLTVAGVAPLLSGENRSFDAEFLVQFNRYF